ncbi:helix-turn-helix domain-containing protein [Massilia sp. CF038]|uniref:winged helix-turn-helix domain-containing protein n=1 Tax=Massilia sp. CF038 TaxID=1881045 RepID=UPI00090F38FE|nr:helix-turn-helix domain-containing protein [Massilia sp. CF038]SHG48736.1 Transcriptional regulatory protein, C terminal [Massilia sp. CF038]
MSDLLLLGRAAGCTDQLASIFLSAGYKVIEVRDVLSCCRQLQSHVRQSQGSPLAREGAQNSDDEHGITIFNADAIASNMDTRSRKEQLRQCIVNLARQLTPGWRLSMRHRVLEAPNGAAAALTSLEFAFIKIFTMVETGEAVSRKQIVQAFGEDYLSYDQNRIDTMVRRLRQKIDAQIGVRLPLNTERVRGFSFGDVLIIEP